MSRNGLEHKTITWKTEIGLLQRASSFGKRIYPENFMVNIIIINNKNNQNQRKFGSQFATVCFLPCEVLASLMNHTWMYNG